MPPLGLRPAQGRRPAPCGWAPRLRQRTAPRPQWARAAALGAAVVQGAAGLLSLEEARAKLEGAGGAEAWPYFASLPDTSLLTYAFSEQAAFPTPPGQDHLGRVASISPYITVFDDYLSDEECEFLKGFGHDRLRPAMVVQSGNNWYHSQTQTRNNEQHWLTATEESRIPLLRHILKRMHRTARVPEEDTEALQIGRYNVSNKYEMHLDTDPEHGVGRPTTLIVYLSDVAKGGETLFPKGRADCNAVWHKDESTGKRVYGAQMCCETPERDAPETVRVPAKRGRAVLFYSHHPDGRVNQDSQHIGCPVIEGTKWIAQRWFRFEPYNRMKYSVGDGLDPRFDGPAPPEAPAKPGVRKLSDDDPRLYLAEGFVTEEERKYLEAFAIEQLKDEVLEEGEEVEEALLPAERVMMDELLAKLDARARQLARLPPAPPSAMIFRRLQRGGHEGRHVDAAPWAGAPDDAPESLTAVQPATVVIHLKVPKGTGGEYVFPKSAGGSTVASCSSTDVGKCCAATDTLKVPARPRDALLILSRDTAGLKDDTAEHLVCPVPEGESLVVEIPFIFEVWDGEVGLKNEQPDAGEDDDDDDDEGGAPSPKRQSSIVFENRGHDKITVKWVAPMGGAETQMGDRKSVV